MKKTLLLFALLPAAALAEDDRPAVGDARNGGKLYTRECQACHGEGGKGGRSAVALTDSSRMTLLRNEQLYGAIQRGEGIKKEKDHKFEGKLSLLDTWDVIAYVKTLHLELGSFFPDATHYVAKEYEIDEHGMKRLGDALGASAPKDKKAAVFTFFKKDGVDANLVYVPQDPIKLDQLKKKEKAGYLVFLPFKTTGFDGELGVAMDQTGKIKKLAVHEGVPNAELVNKSLSRFEGLGKKGQKEPLKPGGDKTMAQIATDVFPVYLRAMESATMYDRDENERTWADSE